MSAFINNTEHMPIRSISKKDGMIFPGVNVERTVFETGIPAIIPIMPPIIAKKVYFAAKSHLNFRESAPIARSIPISRSSSFKATPHKERLTA